MAAGKLFALILIVLGLTRAASAVPSAPSIAWPANGAACGSNRPDIIWTGDAHIAYEVSVGSHNVPTSTDGWYSGVVVDAGSTAGCGPLQPGTNYFVFVRLMDSDGWGPWSESGRWFYTAGEMLNEPYYVGDPVGGQWPHSICYNSERDEYLVAFNDTQGSKWRISYYILNSLGERASSLFTIDHALEGTHCAGAAYCSAHDEYIVAFSGWDSDGGIHDELWVQRVRASDGAQVGEQKWIRTAGAIGDHTQSLYAAYSPASDLYYLVWREQNGPDSDAVYGARLAGSSAAPLGLTHISASQAVPCCNPRVTHNPNADEFFVVYQPNNYIFSPFTFFDYVGQRVRASDGALLGTAVTIAREAQSEEQGNVCYDSAHDRYLVVFQRFFEGRSIWGHFIRADGALIDRDGSVLAAPDPFVIVDSAADGLICWSPQPAWNPVTREFLITFCDMNTNENYGRRLSEDGYPLGTPFPTTGSLTGHGNWLPTPLANPLTGDYLVAWYHGYNDVYTRRYRVHPLPEPDTTAPGMVTGLTAVPGDQQVSLSWTNPSDEDFAATMVRWAIGFYPDRTTGQLLAVLPNVPGSPGVLTHQNISGGVNCYYSVFTCDEVPNYSPAARISAQPSGPRVIFTSSFTTGADGWSTSLWKAGSYDFGSFGWNAAAGASGGGMRCVGAGASDNDFRETREGGEMSRTVSTAHYTGIRISCDLRVGALGSVWAGPGAGGPEFAVDHNDISEQLTILYSTDAGASYSELPPWLDRPALNAYAAYGTRQIDLSGIPEAQNNPAFALKFRWQLNSAADYADLDNIIISGSRMESIQPTISVTSPTSAAHCPSNGTVLAVGGEASDNVGVTLVSWSNSRGGSGSCAVSSPGEFTVYWDAQVALLPGQNLLTFTAFDLAGNARSDTLMAVCCPDPPISVGDAKKPGENALVYVSAKTVTAVFGDHFYIEEPSRAAGIRVKPYSMLGSVVPGAAVDAGGFVRTDPSGERYIYGSARVTGSGSVAPMGMSHAALGGSGWFYNEVPGAGQRGIEGASGLNNVGMLVRVWGKVTQTNTALGHFYIDDGSGLHDGTSTGAEPNRGVRILADPADYAPETMLSITGISGCFKDSAGKLRRQVVPVAGGMSSLD